MKWSSREAARGAIIKFGLGHSISLTGDYLYTLSDRNRIRRSSNLTGLYLR